MHPYVEEKSKLFSLLIDGVAVARGKGGYILELSKQIRDKYPNTNIQIIKG